MLAVHLFGALGLAAAQPAAADRHPPESRCDAEAVRHLVGGRAGAPLRERALAGSGARSLRVIRPGEAITMDYRGDRLNLELDRRGRVKRIFCG